jgi:hypothetical protein
MSLLESLTRTSDAGAEAIPAVIGDIPWSSERRTQTDPTNFRTDSAKTLD